MDARPFDRIDLAAVLPDLTEDEASRIRRAAARIDVPEPAPGRSGWTWFPNRVAPDGIRWVIFGIEFVYRTSMHDAIGFNLHVSREEPPRLAVAISIDVDCWCDQDHNMHEVHSQSWLVGTAAAFTDAFESATVALASWLAGSHEPSIYRAAAGLPNPPVQ
ncbi:hypothetical protein [Nocardia brasiliensis]|uniref:hypothetical protein n=1 Tax=Nocardia brasiliensis TaxID=37326 RepID=UPI001893D302|nr:hypothetical protein [Nocardia brasiliensis]MBF6128810.1 hypothetical protein [Nocardia brasiliensis]